MEPKGPPPWRRPFPGAYDDAPAGCVAAGPNGLMPPIDDGAARRGSGARSSTTCGERVKELTGCTGPRGSSRMTCGHRRAARARRWL